MRVMVVGDAIVDEYQYCDAIGKSSKDPVLATKYESHELFAGGALAVANHVASFVQNVDLLAVLGERHTYEEFVCSHLHAGVTPHFILKPGGHTVIKRRYIDRYTLTKLFEIYVMDESGLAEKENGQACQWLKERLGTYDVVIAADFGHGAISREMISELIVGSRFLGVMTQANAGNRGFHTVTKYPRADYVCLAEHEVRLETRDLQGPLQPMMLDLARKLDCSRFVVTRGRRGCLVLSKGHRPVAVPALAHDVVDRVGAGDAFLSVTALVAQRAVSDETLGFLGNVAGSLAVRVIGNVKPVDKLSTKKCITAILK